MLAFVIPKALPSYSFFLITLLILVFSYQTNATQFQQVANMTIGQNQQAIDWLEMFTMRGTVELALELPPKTEFSVGQIEKITIVAFEMRETTLFLAQTLGPEELQYGKNTTVSFKLDNPMKSAHIYVVVDYAKVGEPGQSYINSSWSIYITVPSYPFNKTTIVSTVIPQWYYQIGTSYKESLGLPDDDRVDNNSLSSFKPAISLSRRFPSVNQISSSLYGSAISTRGVMTVNKPSAVDVFDLHLANLPNFHFSHPKVAAIKRIGIHIHGPGWMHSIRQTSPYKDLTPNTNNESVISTLDSPDLDFAFEQSPCHLNNHKASAVYMDSLFFDPLAQLSPWDPNKTTLLSMIATPTLQFECLNSVYFSYKPFRDPKSPQYNEIAANMPIFITIKAFTGSLNRDILTDLGVENIKLVPTKAGGYEIVGSEEGTITDDNTFTHLQTPNNSPLPVYPYIYNTTTNYHHPYLPFSETGTLAINFDIVFPTDLYPIQEFNRNVHDQLSVYITGAKLEDFDLTTATGHFTAVPRPIYSNEHLQPESQPDPAIYNAVFHSELSFSQLTTNSDQISEAITVPLEKMFSNVDPLRYAHFAALGQLHLHCLLIINSNMTFSTAPEPTTDGFTPQLLLKYSHAQENSAKSDKEGDIYKTIYHPVALTGTTLLSEVAMKPSMASHSPNPNYMAVQDQVGTVELDMVFAPTQQPTSQLEMYIHSTNYLYISVVNRPLFTLHKITIVLESGHFLTTKVANNKTTPLLLSNGSNNSTSISHLCTVTCRFQTNSISLVGMEPADDSSFTKGETCIFPQQPRLFYDHFENSITVDSISHFPTPSVQDTGARAVYIIRCNSQLTQYHHWPKVINQFGDHQQSTQRAETAPTSKLAPIPGPSPSFSRWLNTQSQTAQGSVQPINNHLQMSINTQVHYVHPPQLPQNITDSSKIMIITNKADTLNNLPQSTHGNVPRTRPLGPDDGLGPEHDKADEQHNLGPIASASIIIIIILIIAIGCTLVWRSRNSYGPGLNTTEINKTGPINTFPASAAELDSLVYGDDFDVAENKNAGKGFHQPSGQQRKQEKKLVFVLQGDGDDFGEDYGDDHHSKALLNRSQNYKKK